MTPTPLRVMLYGLEASVLVPEVAARPGLALTTSAPEVIICYGGDGTLLAAELEYPGIPKAPLRNSRRGHRCIAHPPGAVLDRLVNGLLTRTECLKLEGVLWISGAEEPLCHMIALNEFNIHMGHVNSAVRFKLTLDGEPYLDGKEILGDGLVVSTPFGSTAYYNQITHGLFFTGIGVAFKFTTEHTSHMVLPENTRVEVEITRGPALLAFDNAGQQLNLCEGDVIRIQPHPEKAILLTWDTFRFRHPAN